MSESIVVTQLELSQPYEILGMVIHECQDYGRQDNWQKAEEYLKYSAPKGTTHIMKTKFTYDIQFNNVWMDN